MLSNGGVATAADAAAQPIRMLESGPAAGALAAARFGAQAGHPDLMSFDMGGTTAKLCLIEGGRPLVAHELEVARTHRFAKGSGLPIKAPAIDMIEIGVGGGSIARVDGLGLLTVGPDSAGADPGPACYGAGGAAADGHRRRPAARLSRPGVLPRRRHAARPRGAQSDRRRRALQAAGRRVGHPPARQRGHGQRRARARRRARPRPDRPAAVRVRRRRAGARGRRRPRAGDAHGDRAAVGRGDERGRLARGAAGGRLHALAARAGRRRRPRRARSRCCASSTRAGAELLARSGVREVVHERSADMRYVGQGFEVTVPLPAGPLDAAGFRRAFEAVYVRKHGRTGPDVAARGDLLARAHARPRARAAAGLAGHRRPMR